MKKLITYLSLLLTLLAFVSTAYADVPNPYGGPRPRPDRQVIRVYEKREPGFALEKGAGENSFLLKVTLPGPCDWHYTVENSKTKERFVSDIFCNTDFEKETEEKEFFLDLRESGEETKLLINVQFSLYAYTETIFGPKLYNRQGKTKVVFHAYRLEKTDGGYVLK